MWLWSSLHSQHIKYMENNNSVPLLHCFNVIKYCFWGIKHPAWEKIKTWISVTPYNQLLTHTDHHAAFKGDVWEQTRVYRIRMRDRKVFKWQNVVWSSPGDPVVLGLKWWQDPGFVTLLWKIRIMENERGRDAKKRDRGKKEGFWEKRN